MISDLETFLNLLLDSLKLAGPAEQDPGPSSAPVVSVSSGGESSLDVAPPLPCQSLLLLLNLRLVLPCLVAEPRQSP